MEEEERTLHKAISSYQYVSNPYSITSLGGPALFNQKIGDAPYAIGTTAYTFPYSRLANAPTCYSDELYQSRFFHKIDPTASTVINRMAELAAGVIKNRRNFASDEEFNYYNALSDRITTLMQSCASEYLIAGMAIPDYAQQRTMGNRLHASLGRKRYIIPDKLWVRNPDNIILKRVPFGPGRRVYLRIPPDEVAFIINKGVYSDKTEDKDLYAMLVRDFPEYVRAIQEGKTQLPLPNSRPIFRKLQSGSDYPQPFLTPALAALKHKLRIKEMDHSLATKALEAIMHIKAGSDDFPVTEEDTALDDLRTQMKAKDSDASNQAFYKLYTDHTVDIRFIIPPLDALLSSTKYDAVDADIFMAMGFSRVLLVGESSKSNAGAGPTIILGPLAMLEEMRAKFIEWIVGLYQELAELNNFSNYPQPFFDSLVASDTATLVTNATNALKAGVISKNTYAQLYGTDFETEHRQIELEVSTVAKSPVIDQAVQLGQQPHTPPQESDGTPQMPSTVL